MKKHKKHIAMPALRPFLIIIPFAALMILQPACKGKPKADNSGTMPAATTTDTVTSTPAATVPVSADDALIKGTTDATKDYPEVTATVKEGVITVSGEITADRWKQLKMALDGLKPQKVDASGIKIKS